MFHECTDREGFLDAYGCMHQLRPHLEQEQYLELLEQCRKEGGYRLFVWRREGEIVACCGVMPIHTLYYNRCLWVSDLVVDAECRGEGFGSKIMAAVEQWAKDNGYNEIALASGTQRIRAHSFYEQAGYEKVAYEYRKPIL